MVFLIPKNVRQFALIVPCLLAGMFVQASQKPPVAPSHNAWSVRWQPSAIVNGSPVVFLVNPPPRLETLSGTWLDHEVSFSFDKVTKRWSGLAGASLETHPGTYALELKGTTVLALNTGTVLLARPLYFEGNCVVLDHGQGLLTLYLHLSEFKVKEGDRVEGGQELGLSGGTGRATGPHLHIAVRWQGIYLN